MRFGKYLSAPPPRFGVPQFNIPRFRRYWDAEGGQFDADYFAYTIYVTGSPALAANATSIQNIGFDLDSVFECSLITLAAESGTSVIDPAPGIKLALFDQTSTRNLMFVPTFFGNIGGSASFASVLPIPRRFMPGTNLQAIFTEIAGHNWTSFSMTLHGRKLFQQNRNGPAPVSRFRSWEDPSGIILCEDLFYYTFDSKSQLNGSLAPGAGTLSLRVEVESDFEWIATSACVNSGGNDSFDPTSNPMSLFTVNIKDRSTGRYLSNAPVPIYEYAGGNQNPNGQNNSFFAPLILPEPKIWAAGTEIDFAYNNGGIETFQNFQFTMIGRKIFEQSF